MKKIGILFLGFVLSLAVRANASVSLKESVYDDFSVQKLDQAKWTVEKGDAASIFFEYGIEKGVFRINQAQPAEGSLRLILNKEFSPGESVEFDMNVLQSAGTPVGGCITGGINQQQIFLFGLWSNRVLGAGNEKGLYHTKCLFTNKGAVFIVTRPDGTLWEPKEIALSSLSYRFSVETRTGQTGAITVEYGNFKVATAVPSLDSRLAQNIQEGVAKSIEVTVINPLPYELKDYPVTILAEKLNLPSNTNLTSISIMDKEENAVVTSQVDDLDNSKSLTRADEIVCLINLKPYSFKRLTIYYDTTATQYAPAGSAGFVLQDNNSSYLLKAKNYFIGGDNSGNFYYEMPSLSGHFFYLKPWDNEKQVYKSSGNVRLVLISEVRVPENGLLTRRIDAYPNLLKMTSSASSENKENDCSLSAQGAGSFFFGMPHMGDIQGLRYKNKDGFQEDLVKTPPASNPNLYGGPGDAQSIDMLCPEVNLVFALTASVDYMPMWGMFAPHGYIQGGLAFGWRPPVRILKDKPHVQELYLIAHKGGTEEYQALDRTYREGITVVYDKSGLSNLISKDKEYIERLSSALQVFPLEKIKLDLEKLRSALNLSLSGLNNGQTDVCLKNYLTGKSILEKIKIPDNLLKIKEILAAGESALKETRYANYEVSPTATYLKKADVYLTAGVWDFQLNRYQRSLERLERAAVMYCHAKDYLEHAVAGRITPAEIKGNKITPYVTFSMDPNKRIGFDVDHSGFGMGIGTDEGWQSIWSLQPKEDEYNWKPSDRALDTLKKEGKKSVVILGTDVPGWFKKKYNPPDGYEALVDPEMLGYLPEHMKAWGDFFEKFSERYGNRDEVLAWSVINEPAYYHYGGATNPLLEKAIKNYLKKEYGSIDKLNQSWGENFSSFDSITLPASWQENKAAWYDVMLGKMKCFEGALKWQADLLTSHSKCKLTGCKFVPCLLSPYAAKNGSAVNPFVNNKAQQGVSMTDLYLDGEWETILRTQELYDSNKESPVISPETGVASKPEERVYKFHYYPDEKAQSWAWILFQHGLYGCHYWTWSGSEEYASLDWDGAMCDFTVQASLMNQNYRVFGDILSDLRPVRNIGYYYPYATFIQGSNSEIEPYQRLFWTLTEMGYQVKIFSTFNMDQVANEFKYIIVPPAPYLEKEAVPKLKAYAEKGGILIVTGPDTGVYDEYAKPYKKDKGTVLSEILGADRYGYVKEDTVKLNLDNKEVVFNNVPVWGILKAATASPLVLYADNQTAITENRCGQGKVVFIPAVLGASFGEGSALINLVVEWKFKFGDSWPQAPGVTATSTAGHKDKGLEEKWYSSEYDDTAWGTIKVPGVWEENGYPDLDGWGWYRYTFTLPGTLEGKKIYFAGSHLDDRAKVYVNGSLVRETSGWDQVFKVDVSKYLKYGGKNLIALRIEDNAFLGGVREYVSLNSPDVLNADQIILKSILARLGKNPETVVDKTDIYRTLMKDSQGNQYLLIANESGGKAEGEVSIPRAAPEERQGKMVNLFTGEYFDFREDAGGLKIKFYLEPYGIGFVPLKKIKEDKEKQLSGALP